MGIELFDSFDPKRADALRDYYQYARDKDLFLTYVIINPQADRAKNPHQQTDSLLTAHLCDQDSQGITVKGAKMLGTSAIMASITPGRKMSTGMDCSVSSSGISRRSAARLCAAT